MHVSSGENPIPGLTRPLRPVRILGLAFLLGGLGLGLASPLQAQILPRTVEPERFDKRYQPLPTPKSRPREPSRLPPPPKPAPKREPGFVLKKIVFEGATAYPPGELQRAVRRALGRRVTLDQLQFIAEVLTRKYRNDGYILSRVVVPPQKIEEEGVVRLQVLEGYVDQVKFKGERRGPVRMLKRFRDAILKSRPLHVEVLERYLLLFNDQPGVRARSILKASEKTPGASELTIVLEHRPVNARAGLDNRGSRFNGPVQASASLSVNSLLKLYERIRFDGVVTSQTDELRFFNGSVDLPVTNEGTRLFFSASSASTQPGGGLELFNVDGDSTAFNLQLNHPVWRTRERNLSVSFGAGLINSETTILNVTTAKDRVRFIRAGVTLDLVDRLRGINVFSLRWTQGLNLFNARETGEPFLTRQFGESDFTRFDGEILRLQELFPRWNLLISSAWQVGLDNLLASQEFTAGGPRFVRAYDASEITGDSGATVLGELQYTHPLNQPWLKSIQPYLFFDYGAVFHKREPGRTVFFEDIKSTGGGVRLNVNEWVSGYLEIGKPLDKIVSSEGDRDVRVFFGLTARY